MSTIVRHDKDADHLKSTQTPLVMLDNILPDLNVDFVVPDNEMASAVLTKHLLSLGHRRIGLLRGNTGLHSTESRQQGFIDTMNGAGVPVDMDLVLDADYAVEKARDQTFRMMTHATPPTAIVAMSSAMATGALWALRDLNISCPEQVSVVGIDRVSSHDVIQPRLTITEQPVEQMASTAAAFLINRIDHVKKDTPLDRQVFVSTPQFSLGVSTAPVA